MELDSDKSLRVRSYAYYGAYKKQESTVALKTALQASIGIW